jgi:hypothetical protein
MLFDRGYGARLAIASGPWAPRDVEARANAFGAMLLMPTELHTSYKATLEHLKNLNFLSEEEHDRIEIDGGASA